MAISSKLRSFAPSSSTTVGQVGDLRLFVELKNCRLEVDGLIRRPDAILRAFTEGGVGIRDIQDVFNESTVT